MADIRHGIDLYDAARHHHLAATFGGHDPGVCAHACGGMCSALAGFPAEAHALLERGLALAELLEHPHSIAHACMVSSLACACARDMSGIRTFVPRLLAVAEKFSFLPYAAMGSFLSRLFPEHGAVDFNAISDDFTRARTLTPLPIPVSALMAEHFIAASRFAEALGIVDETVSTLKSPNLGLYVSELYRLRALALNALNRKDESQAALEAALKTTREQGGHLLEIRTQCTRLRLGEVAAEEELRACVAAWPANEACADVEEAKLALASR